MAGAAGPRRIRSSADHAGATDTRTAIREATEADLPACVAMGLRFAATVGEYARLLPVNAEAMERLGRWLLAYGVILMAERDDAPIGMFGLTVQPHPMTGLLTGMELFWWVNDDARGHGIRLLHAGEQWAKIVARWRCRWCRRMCVCVRC